MIKQVIISEIKKLNSSFNTLKPNFFIPGAGRSGTSRLHTLLNQHPDIYLSEIKEPAYFSFNFHLGEKWYLNHFLSKKNYPIVGESSVSYLFWKKAVERIFNFNPDAKFIFMLRDPIERVYSNYKTQLQYYGDFISFKEKLQKFPNQSTLPGKYFKHISRFLKYFPREQLFFVIFEEFIKNEIFFLKEICEFLSVNPNFNFKLSNSWKNSSLMPRSLKLQRFNRYFFSNGIRIEKDTHRVSRLIKFMIRSFIDKINQSSSPRKKFPKMDKESILFLKKFYYEEVLNLEELLGKKLIHWKHFYE